MSPWNSTEYDIPDAVAELRERRLEFDIAQADIGKRLADHERYDATPQTLGSYVSAWETGKKEPDDEDLDLFEDAIEAIVAERDESNPPCSDPECPKNETNLPPVYVDGEPYCELCYYTREIEAVEDGHGHGHGHGHGGVQQ